MATNTVHLEMIFRASDGATVTIVVPDPKPELTAATVQTAMQEIIAKNVISSTHGDLMLIVDKQIRNLSVAPLA